MIKVRIGDAKPMDFESKEEMLKYFETIENNLCHRKTKKVVKEARDMEYSNAKDQVRHIMGRHGRESEKRELEEFHYEMRSAVKTALVLSGLNFYLMFTKTDGASLSTLLLSMVTMYIAASGDKNHKVPDSNLGIKYITENKLSGISQAIMFWAVVVSFVAICLIGCGVFEITQEYGFVIYILPLVYHLYRLFVLRIAEKISSGFTPEYRFFFK